MRTKPVVSVLIIAAVLGQSERTLRADFEIRLTNGPVLVGEIAELNDQHLAVRNSKVKEPSPTLIPLESVTGFAQRKGGKPIEIRSVPTILQLSDGSQVAFKEFTVKDQRLVVELYSGGRAELPFRELRQIRYRSHDANLAKQWSDIEQSRRTGDVLVIRKAIEGGTASFSLDSLEGVVKEFRGDVIRFEFDGDLIDVKLERIDGIILLRPGSANRTSAGHRIKDQWGSQWTAKSVRIRQQALELDSDLGSRVILPLSQIARADLVPTNSHYLTDDEPESVDWRDVTDRLSIAVPGLRKLFEPKSSASHPGLMLSLGTRSFERGWALYPISSVSYRLPAGFSRLQGLAGFDEEAPRQGEIRLAIMGDGRELFARTLTPSEDKPVELDVDISGVRRLEFRISPGARLLQHLRLNLCDLRISNPRGGSPTKTN